MSGCLSDYLYDLPAGLVADRPVARRQDSRMLIVHRESGRIEHGVFAEFPRYVNPPDLLVLNASKVIPARIHDVTGKIEMMLLEKLSELCWKAMVNPGKKMKTGAVVEAAGTSVKVLDVLGDGTRLLGFESPPDLERYGKMPIPPYLHRDSDEEDKERYQTVYAREPGSVAAPTAGLHFTRDMIDALRHVFITLHVGAGTFQPVKTEHIAEHRMHQEHYSITSEASLAINSTKVDGGRIVAVGTTTTRLLESQPAGPLAETRGSTEIFIRPPYQFRRVDVLLTNFHLPGSTLLMLVSAFAGRELIMAAYAEAIMNKYRFFSYGDCMLIV